MKNWKIIHFVRKYVIKIMHDYSSGIYFKTSIYFIN